jgi:fumarate reductase iron-sulfur subunit
MATEITLRVSRYQPDADTAPTFQEYPVPLRDDWAVLDALNYIKDELDPTLSFRWSCRMGICGSCGFTINGQPKLGCGTFLVDHAPGPIQVEPLRNFPVIRDLVIEMTDFLHKLGSVSPWIIRDESADDPAVELRQTPTELAEYQQYSMCINCMLCYSACPVYGLEPTFIGPAAIALGMRYNLDSRDEGAAERHDVLSDDEGVWGCTFVGECTRACPKGVDPAGAIQRAKLTAANETVKAFLLPKWARR